MTEDREDLQSRLQSVGSPLWDGASNGAKFADIRGLCRTCTHGFIRRREHSERPQIICQALFEHPHRVPPDIMHCSDYKRRGEVTLREMGELALLIDARETGGQYL